MTRPRLAIKPETYADLVALRLRELRDKMGWTIDDWRNKLAEAGVCQEDGSPIPLSTAYSYERGKKGGGADLPLEYYPAVAWMYGYKSPHAWLPGEWPDYWDA